MYIHNAVFQILYQLHKDLNFTSQRSDWLLNTVKNCLYFLYVKLYNLLFKVLIKEIINVCSLKVWQTNDSMVHLTMQGIK